MAAYVMQGAFECGLTTSWGMIDTESRVDIITKNTHYWGLTIIYMCTMDIKQPFLLPLALAIYASKRGGGDRRLEG